MRSGPLVLVDAVRGAGRHVLARLYKAHVRERMGHTV